jgi:hypothetical protein
VLASAGQTNRRTKNQELSAKAISFYRVLRVIPIHFSLARFLLGAITTPASVVVSNETAPPGGTVQLKFSLSRPALIATGRLSVDLDPTMFASVTTASVFSANGDAYGFAQITGSAAQNVNVSSSAIMTTGGPPDDIFTAWANVSLPPADSAHCWSASMDGK